MKRVLKWLGIVLGGVVALGDCRGCHDQGLAAVTGGRHPRDRTLDEGMPRYGMSDEDLNTSFNYLASLEPVASK